MATMSQSPATILTPSAADRSARAGLFAAAATLWRREMVRFFRQRNRVAGAVLTPMVIWLLLGFGLGRTFTPPSSGDSGGDFGGAATTITQQASVGYEQYFYPGVVSMMLLFTAIFTTFSVIEDRREGFMQGVLVAPTPRLAIVLGKSLGGASIAVSQGVLMLALWLLVGPFPGVVNLLLSIAVMFLLAMGMTAMGLCFAWPMDSTAGFHAIMNLILMPLWVLSGAMFPVDSAPAPMRLLMWVNPLTYGQQLLSAWMTDGRVNTGAPTPFWVSTIILIAFVVAMMTLAANMVNRPRKDGA